MLRITDNEKHLVVEVDGRWLHPVLWLFEAEAAPIRDALAQNPELNVYDSVVGTAAVCCYRLLGARNIEAGLAGTTAFDLAAQWEMRLRAEREVAAIECASESDVRAVAEEGGGSVPDPSVVLEILSRRASRTTPALTVRWGTSPSLAGTSHR